MANTAEGVTDTRTVYASGSHLGENHPLAELETRIEYHRLECPKSARTVFTVTPLSSLGTPGKPLTGVFYNE